MAQQRYVIDTGAFACALYPNHQVIVDTHAGGVVVALCPIEDHPVCEGWYSFAPLVQRALEREAHAMAVASSIVRTEGLEIG